MNKRVLAAFVAAALAVVGIVAVVIYASGANNRAYDNAELVGVYQVVSEVPVNTTGSDLGSSVKLVELPRAAVVDGAVSDLETISDLRTTTNLLPGEQLIRARFNVEGEAGVNSTVPEGSQQISVSLGSAATNAGMVVPGSIVGIMVTGPSAEGMMTKLIAQKVLVTAVTPGGDGAIVTFAADGELATKIAAAAESGSIRLTVQDSKTNTNAGDGVSSSTVVQ